MTARDQNFTLARGSDASIVVVVAGVDGSAWTYEATFRHKASQVALAVVTTPAIDATYDGAGTVVTIPLADTATDNAAIGQYEWSLWRVSEGSEQPLSIGTMTLERTSRG